MQVRQLLRDVFLVAAAAAAGWWCHGTTVHAQRGADMDGNLAFQFMPGGDQSSLSIYSPGDHTIYVYPRVGVGNANISCEYMFHLSRAGRSCPARELQTRQRVAVKARVGALGAVS